MPHPNFPLISKHEGVWEGTFTNLDPATGAVTDRYQARITARIEGDQFHQTNDYTWDDGRTQSQSFTFTFRDGALMADLPFMTGSVREVDDRTILLSWSPAGQPNVVSQEMTTLIAPDRRARMNQRFVDGNLVGMTYMVERKTA